MRDEEAHVSDVDAYLIDVLLNFLDGEGVVEVFGSDRVYSEDSFISQIKPFRYFAFRDRPLTCLWVELIDIGLQTF